MFDAVRNYPMFVMSPPFGMSADSPNNVFMEELSPEEREVDIGRALQQWLEVYHLLAANGMVAILGQGGWLQDQSYVANLGLVMTHLEDMPVVVSNFTAPERTGETIEGSRFFQTLHASEVITCPYKFEGEADCKLLNDNVYAVGVGMRTSIKAAAWMEREFDMRCIPIQMTNEYAYHLDCLLFAIDRENALVVTSELDRKELRRLEKHISIIEVPSDLLRPGATNLVRCNRLLLCASTLWDLDRDDENYEGEKKKVEFITDVAANFRLEPCFFNLSEFEKSGAALSCLVMHLTRPEWAD